MLTLVIDIKANKKRQREVQSDVDGAKELPAMRRAVQLPSRFFGEVARILNHELGVIGIGPEDRKGQHQVTDVAKIARFDFLEDMACLSSRL